MAQRNPLWFARPVNAIDSLHRKLPTIVVPQLAPRIAAASCDWIFVRAKAIDGEKRPRDGVYIIVSILRGSFACLSVVVLMWNRSWIVSLLWDPEGRSLGE